MDRIRSGWPVVVSVRSGPVIGGCPWLAVATCARIVGNSAVSGYRKRGMAFMSVLASRCGSTGYLVPTDW